MTSASEGIKRTGEWLDRMAKRRSAAQATVKRSTEGIRLPLTNAKVSKRTRRSIIPSTSQCKPPLAREMKVARKVTTCSKQDSVKKARSSRFSRQIVQVVIPASLQHVASSPRPAVNSVQNPPRPRTEPSLTNSSMSFGGRSSSSEAIHSVRADGVSTIEDLPKEEGEEYDVERILAEKTGSGVHQFLVQWVEYDEPTWVPAHDCFCEDLINTFRAISRVRTMRARCLQEEKAAQQLKQRELRAQRRAEKRSVHHFPYQVRSLETETRQNTRAAELLLQARLSMDQAEASGKEEGIVLPRCARANTARFSTRPPTPVTAHAPRDWATGEIWQRSKTENMVQVVSVSNAVREITEEVNLGQENERENQKNSQTAIIESMQVQREGSRKPDFVKARRQQERPISIKKLDRELFKVRQMGERANRPRLNKLQRQSQEGAKKHLNLGTRKRGPHLSVHIRFDENEIPIDATQLGMPSFSLSTNRPDTSCGDALRKALIQEKKAARPSLLRHEFSSHMSQKHAEALINHTQASPERAFGFSLPSNSILLSIEKDED